MQKQAHGGRAAMEEICSQDDSQEAEHKKGGAGGRHTLPGDIQRLVSTQAPQPNAHWAFKLIRR